jgi:hypothetical protein
MKGDKKFKPSKIYQGAGPDAKPPKIPSLSVKEIARAKAAKGGR